MIKRLIYYFLERRHYWRYVGFSEVAEIYASRTLRTLAASIVTVFAAVYLYQNHYSLTFIFAYFTLYFLLRILVSYPSALLIARYGPKRATLLSNVLFVPALIALSQIPLLGVAGLAVYGVFQAFSVAIYDIAYNVGFSKVHHPEYAGKELGYMQMLDQVARGASPVIGGFIAYWYGPQATFVVASLLFAAASVPLLFSPELVRTRQLLDFRSLPWRKIRSSMLGAAGLGADFIGSTIMWQLFVAIVIFGTNSSVVYAELGVLASLSIAVGILTSKVVAMLVDRRKGQRLLEVGVGIDVVMHLTRPFIGTPVGVILTNSINEMATTSYTMPFTRGMYALADELPGHRIAYLTCISALSACGAAGLSLIMLGISLLIHTSFLLQIGFVITAVTALLISQSRFPLMRRS